MLLQTSSLDRLSSLKVLLLMMTTIICLFVSDKELFLSLYINGSSVTFYIFTLFIPVILLLLNGKFYIDFITAILMSRLVIYIVPLLYTNNVEGYWGNYFAVVASFVAYFVASQNQTNGNEVVQKKVSIILALFLVVSSAQVIFVFLKLTREFGSLNINLMKYYLVTPVGGSNYIACIILPLLIFVWNFNTNKLIKYSSVMLALVSLVIIQSKNAIIVLIIFIGFKVAKLFVKNMRSYIGSSDNKAFGLGLTLFIFILGISVIYMIVNYVLMKWNMGMSYNEYSIYEMINALSSNRLNVYLSEMIRWSNHIFLGNGLGYELGYTRAHNWLIDLLVQSGVIGMALYIAALLLWFRKIRYDISNNKFIKASFLSILVFLIQGLAEVSIFTISVDILLWYLIGLSVAVVNSVRMNKG
ncbi:hypothetical protein D3P08_26685 [Paenibacillus nanensis]|uniref:O-antigen ligase domain-containing protein n=1 Tax=Paenibacillus nanensis TaxID=393251 RepID=A0A3A1UH32_9BACL|nr:hypothetical protein [Paenibacillus nanensis]RIX45870.1 hypothetical protein D3P08_26685 [Paenibacillus nanensis]